MFVHVIQGQAADRDGLRAAFDRWAAELAPRERGWLGTTAGLAADDGFVALVRFASEADARRHGDRPEQQDWWVATTKLFVGTVTVRDSARVRTFLDAGSDRAGFVQVLLGRTTTPERMVALVDSAAAELFPARPDVVGGIVAQHGDDGFTGVAYFTSEPAARQGERDATFRQRYADDVEPVLRDVRYVDLPHPWLYSPR